MASAVAVRCFSRAISSSSCFCRAFKVASSAVWAGDGGLCAGAGRGLGVLVGVGVAVSGSLVLPLICWREVDRIFPSFSKSASFSFLYSSVQAFMAWVSKKWVAASDSPCPPVAFQELLRLPLPPSRPVEFHWWFQGELLPRPRPRPRPDPEKLGSPKE